MERLCYDFQLFPYHSAQLLCLAISSAFNDNCLKREFVSHKFLHFNSISLLLKDTLRNYFANVEMYLIYLYFIGIIETCGFEFLVLCSITPTNVLLTQLPTAFNTPLITYHSLTHSHSKRT